MAPSRSSDSSVTRFTRGPPTCPSRRHPPHTMPSAGRNVRLRAPGRVDRRSSLPPMSVRLRRRALALSLVLVAGSLRRIVGAARELDAEVVNSNHTVGQPQHRGHRVAHADERRARAPAPSGCTSRSGRSRSSPGQNNIANRGAQRAAAAGRRLDRRHPPEPRVRERQDPGRRRHPPAPRGVAQPLARRTRPIPACPSASSRSARRRRSSSCRRATATRTRRPTTGSSTTCSTTSRSNRDAGVDHVRHRLHPGDLGRGEGHQAGAADLDGRAERRDLPGVRRAAGAAARTASTPTPTTRTNPYLGGPAKNVWTVDQDGTLLATAGHVHPGGLRDDLWLQRNGAVVPDRPRRSPAPPTRCTSSRRSRTTTSRPGRCRGTSRCRRRPTTGACRCTRATSSRSPRPTSRSSRRGTRAWGSWSCGWPYGNARHRPVHHVGERARHPHARPPRPRTTTTAARRPTRSTTST